jgi:hypothetical protein
MSIIGIMSQKKDYIVRKIIMTPTKNEKIDEKKMQAFEAEHRVNLSKAMGDIFVAAAKRVDLQSFALAFLKSETFVDFFTNYTIFSQSATYVLAEYKEELKEKNSDAFLAKKYEEGDIAYWFGYMFGIWHQELGENFSDLTGADIEWLWYNYEVLHTQSVEYVHDLYLEDKEREKDQ